MRGSISKYPDVPTCSLGNFEPEFRLDSKREENLSG